MPLDNKYVCSGCGKEFEFCLRPQDSDADERAQLKCPECGTGYVRKVFTFPKGYSSQPHG
jgi:DNA-directed RNA polymerase subunit RPC12/RpoP